MAVNAHLKYLIRPKAYKRILLPSSTLLSRKMQVEIKTRNRYYGKNLVIEFYWSIYIMKGLLSNKKILVKFYRHQF